MSRSSGGDRLPGDSRLPGGEPASRNHVAAATVDGTVREALPNALYRIELDDGRKVLGHISGAVRTRIVRVLPGDRVTVELSAYDLTRGRIIRRHR